MLETNKYDFGSVAFGKRYVKYFVVTNSTGATATITNVYNGGCTCVQSTIDKDVLQPSETAKMRVEINPGSTGKFRRMPQLWYKTDDFGPIAETIEITADVKEDSNV